MKSFVAALAAAVALVAGSLAATAPASAVVRDDGAHHARHAKGDDGKKRDDGAHRARHTKRDDGPRHR